MSFYDGEKIFRLFLIVAFAVGSAAAQNSRIASQDDIEDALKLAPCKSSERREAVRKLFLDLGAREADISDGKFEKGSNLLVKIKGATDETIIVGAHYDKVEDGCGAIDNWTGVVILAHLYKTISGYSTDKSYVFVAFDKEESGLLGSKAMAKSIPKESYPKYCAMVNIDSFGFTAPQAASNISDWEMVTLAKRVAEGKQIPFNAAALGGADSDSSPFRAKNIPAITFHGLAHNWRSFLHGKDDQLKNVEPRSVYVGYRFIFEYLVELETVGCGKYR